MPERALGSTYGCLTVNDIAPCTTTYIMQTKLGQLLAYHRKNWIMFHTIVVHVGGYEFQYNQDTTPTE